MTPPNLPILANLVANWYESVKTRPTAIVLPNDMLAIHFMREMVRRGYHLPEDLSVTGCDNIPFTEVVTPTLTSFGERPDDSLAEALVDSLLQRMADPEAPGRTVRAAMHRTLGQSLALLRYRGCRIVLSRLVPRSLQRMLKEFGGTVTAEHMQELSWVFPGKE